MTLLLKELLSDMSVPAPPNIPDPYLQSLSLSPMHDTGSQHCHSISECFHLAFDEHFDSTSEVESSHSHSAGNTKTEYSHPISQVSESHTPEPEATPSMASFLRRLSAKLPRLPVFRQTFHGDDNDVASISWIWFLFGMHPPNTLGHLACHGCIGWSWVNISWVD